MPLDRYREHADDDESAESGSPEAEAPAQSESKEHWLDPESFWDTTAERPLPEFDWGDD